MSNEAMAAICGVLGILAVVCFVLALKFDIEGLFWCSQGLGVAALLIAVGGVSGLYSDPEPVQLVCKLIDGDYYCKG